MKQKVLYILLLLFACAWNTRAWGQTYNGGTWYSLYDTGTKTNTNALSRDFGEITGIFAPTNKAITLEYKKYSLLSTTGTLIIYDDGNNGAYTEIGKQTDITDYKNWNTYSKQCNENISKIRFRMDKGDGISVKNIKIPLAKHILLNDGSTYGTTSINVGEQFEATPMRSQCTKTYTINLRSFLTNGNITITSNNSAFHFGSGSTTKTFNVGANACASTNGNGNCGTGTLGKIDNYAIILYFTPSIPGTNYGTITISDGTSNATVTISGQGKPVFNFTATAYANIEGTGSATASVDKSSITGEVGDASAQTTSTFSATPNRYYKFLGWGTSANATSYVSIENPYQPNVTNNTPGSTQNISLYAIFEPKTITLDPTDITSLIVDDYKNVTLNRTLKQGYNTLSLPFDTNVATLTGRNNSDDWVAQLALVTYNGNDGYTLYFTKITNGVITANQPYILHLGAELVNPSWTNMTVVAAQGETVSVAKNYDWSMISNYTPNFSMEGKYGVVNSTGKIQKGANGSTLNAFTAYFTYTGAANVKAVVSYLDNEGELTKIEGVDFDDSTENETIYDLQGRKVEKPGKGIYIINGKKIHK